MDTPIERGETAFPLSTFISDDSGPVTGLTVETTLYDPAQDLWLNGGTGAWEAVAVPLPAVESVAGSYLVALDVSQADSASESLEAFSEITSGAQGVGRVARDTLRIRNSLKDVPTDTWEASPTALEQPGNAAEALLAAGGSLTPAAIAAECVDQILSALPESYENATGSVGQILYNIDSDTLKALLAAALGKITRFGYAFLAWPTQEIFVDEVGAAMVRPIMQNGELADLTGATIAWRFVNTLDATEETRVGAISATPGHAEYITVAGDQGGALFGVAGQWRAYATATLPGGEVATSERMLLKVQAVV